MLFYLLIMEVKIVLGSLFGDEGKGNTVQWLCKEAIKEGKHPCVVRFSGGPQAGHTVVHNGITHICSSFGSGVLLGVPTFYVGRNTFVDPLCIENERKVLAEKGILNPELYITREVELITPYDVADQQAWAKDNPNMTCGKGVMSAKLRGYIPINWLSDESKKIIFMKYLDVADTFYKNNDKNYEASKEIIDDWLEAAKKLNYLYNTKSIEDFDVVIFEGTQGLLLDEEFGLYPYTTSTRVGLNGIPEKYLKDAEAYLVTRTYLTRHGNAGKLENDFFKNNPLKIPSNKLETNVFNEFQGEFKTAKFSDLYFSAAVQRHHLNNYQKKYNLKFNIVITHTDCFEYMIEPIIDSISFNLFLSDITLDEIYLSDNPESNFKKF